MSEAQTTQAPEQQEPTVDLKLPVSVVNYILMVFTEVAVPLPMKHSLRVVELVKRQADISLALQQAAAQKAAQPATPGAPTGGEGAATSPAKAPRKRPERSRR